MLRVAHILSETVSSADDDDNVKPMVGDRGVGDELADDRDRWSLRVSLIVTVVVIFIIILIIYRRRRLVTRRPRC